MTWLDGPWQSCMLVRGLEPGECASWVQAWGSVAAIVASVAVVLLVQYLERRRQQKRDGAAYTRYLETAFRLVCGMHKIAKIMLKGERLITESSHGRRKILSELDVVHIAFSKLDLSAFRDEKIVFAVLEGHAANRTLASAIASACEPGHVSAEGVDIFYVTGKDICNRIEVQVEMLRETILARGGVAQFNFSDGWPEFVDGLDEKA